MPPARRERSTRTRWSGLTSRHECAWRRGWIRTSRSRPGHAPARAQHPASRPGNRARVASKLLEPVAERPLRAERRLGVNDHARQVSVLALRRHASRRADCIALDASSRNAAPLRLGTQRERTAQPDQRVAIARRRNQLAHARARVAARRAACPSITPMSRSPGVQV